MKVALIIIGFAAMVVGINALNPLSFPFIALSVGVVVLFAIPRTRAISAALAPLITSVIVYETLRIFAEGSLNRLSTASVLALETKLFSIDGVLWVTEIQNHSIEILDICLLYTSPSPRD